MCTYIMIITYKLLKIAKSDFINECHDHKVEIYNIRMTHINVD